MLKVILVTIGTIIIGPTMFFILSRYIIAKGKHLKKYPVGIIDGSGDLIFLPLFNAVAITHIKFLKVNTIIISVLIGLIITSMFVKWRRDIAHHNDWSRPRKYIFNKGGWYHATYMFLQASFVTYALILNFNSLIIWLPLTGYILLVGIRFVQIHEKINNF